MSKAPTSHPRFAEALADRGLLTHQEVRAAGTPHTVLALAPEELIKLAGGSLADVRGQSAGVP